MATIAASDSARIYQIREWLGLNESPDGDTGLKLGEAAEMRNFRITREKHLQIRPGWARVCALAEGEPVRGLWYGYVAGRAHLLAVCGGRLWDVNPQTWDKTDCGAIKGEHAFFFGFSNKVYILTGEEYYSWNGKDAAAPVEGYIPLVATAAVPGGGGTLLESVNKLHGKRRERFSPDGTAKDFYLVESGVDEVLSVEGTSLSYTVDKAAGKVSFASAPPKGTNTVTITWRKGNGDRDKVTNMRFSELYNGASDSRVFLYGDGTNEAIYSGLDEQGQACAEYFPDLNVMAVDSANTPITAMIRHYDRLLVFKTDSAHSVQYDTLTLAGGAVTAAFYASTLNREIGCAAPGQAKLVQNNPRTLFGRGCYEWTMNVYTTRDERNANRLSDRVESTLGGFSLEHAIAFDDEGQQEYWLVCGEKALLHNYANDTWYVYEGLPIQCMEAAQGELYFGTPDGSIGHLSRRYRNDDLSPIDAYWESGAVDFNMDWRRKYSAAIWVGIKPESQGRITVTAQSNRKSDYAKKDVSAGLSSFSNASFAHWSFGTNRKPQVHRVRMKVKKFTFYKLLFSSRSASAACTVVSADIQVRYTGNVK